MRLIQLSEKFYTEYGSCPEILKKVNRPYVCMMVKIDDILYAIPFRHHISHSYAYITYGKCGLDYTKAVVIKDSSYISANMPWVDSQEWNKVKRDENVIFHAFRSYVRQYKRALKHKDNPRSKNILKYSALQYFDI